MIMTNRSTVLVAVLAILGLVIVAVALAGRDPNEGAVPPGGATPTLTEDINQPTTPSPTISPQPTPTEDEDDLITTPEVSPQIQILTPTP